MKFNSSKTTLKLTIFLSYQLDLCQIPSCLGLIWSILFWSTRKCIFHIMLTSLKSLSVLWATSHLSEKERQIYVRNCIEKENAYLECTWRTFSWFIAFPEYLHGPEITCAEQSRHFSKSVGFYLEQEDRKINRSYSSVVIHVRIKLHSSKL